MSERDVFLSAAVATGCPEDLARNLIVAQVWLQERQLAASAAAEAASCRSCRSTPAATRFPICSVGQPRSTPRLI